MLVRSWSLYRRRAPLPTGAGEPEKALGPEHSDAATSVNNLIWRHFSYNQGQYAKAKPLYQRALAIWEKALDPEHPNVVTSLNNLAALSYNQGPIREGRAPCLRALAILEKAALATWKRPWARSTQTWPAALTIWRHCPTTKVNRSIREGPATFPTGAGDPGKAPSPEHPNVATSSVYEP